MGRPDAGEGGGMTESYEDFIARKQNIAPPVGFDPGDTLPAFLKPFQALAPPDEMQRDCRFSGQEWG